MHMYNAFICILLCLCIPGCLAGLGCHPAQAPPLSWGCHGCAFQPLVLGPAAHPGLLFEAEASGCSQPAVPAPSPGHTPPGPLPSTHPSIRRIDRNMVVGGQTNESVRQTVFYYIPVTAHINIAENIQNKLCR